MSGVSSADRKGAMHDASASTANPASENRADTPKQHNKRRMKPSMKGSGQVLNRPSSGRSVYEPEVPYNSPCHDPLFSDYGMKGPKSAEQSINRSCLAFPRRTALIQTEGFLAMPDAALCIIIQHLDKQAQLQLGCSCKAMAQVVFTRQQQQTTLVVKEHDDVEWSSLLTVLSWLPMTAWRLGCSDADDDGSRKSSRLLDKLLGWTSESVLSSGYAAINKDVSSFSLLMLWSMNFSGGTWKPALRYPSVVNVTLQGMKLAFYVPPALAIACPNIKQLTLVSCTVGVEVRKSCRASTKLVLETVCSSLETLRLNNAGVCSDWLHNNGLASKHISRMLPNLRNLTAIGSVLPYALMNILVHQVHSFEYDRATRYITSPGLPLPAQLVTHSTELRSLFLPTTTMTGSEFETLTRMPKLRTLAVYDFVLQHGQDYRQYNTHLQHLHMCNNRMELTTLGRLPLQSLKNDPISGRPCLTIILPYKDPLAETTRAVNNLRGCRSYPLMVDGLTVKANINDSNEHHADVLLELLPAFNAKDGITLSKVVLGGSHDSIFGKLHSCCATSFKMDSCHINVESFFKYWRGILQYLPNVKEIRVTNPTQNVLGKEGALIVSLCQAWASVGHQHTLTFSINPSRIADSTALEAVTHPDLPSAVFLTVHADDVLVDLPPPKTGKTVVQATFAIIQH